MNFIKFHLGRPFSAVCNGSAQSFLVPEYDNIWNALELVCLSSATLHLLRMFFSLISAVATNH